MRSLLRGALAVCAPALLALPSTAHAGYDLTISNAATTSGAVSIVRTAGASTITPTGVGANVSATDLNAELAASGTVRFAPAAGGAQPGDVTIAAPVSHAGSLFFGDGLGTVGLDAAVAVTQLVVQQAAGVTIDTPTVPVTSLLLSSAPVTLARDVAIGGGIAQFEAGVFGAHALTVPWGVFTSGAGTPATPLTGITASRVQLTGTLRATGDIHVGGLLEVAGAAGLNSASGTITVDDAVETSPSTNLGTLAVQAGTAAWLKGTVGAARVVRTLDVSAPTIELGGDVTTSGTQFYAGALAVAANRTLTGPTVLLNADTTLGAGVQLTVAAATAGTVGTLHGDATSRVRLTGAGRFTLGGATRSDPVGLRLEGSGRTDVTGAYPDSAIDLAAGTLGGTGATGAIALAAGTTLDPGTLSGTTPVRGTLTAAAATFAPGTTLRLDGFRGDEQFDALHVTGPAQLGGAQLDLAVDPDASVAPGSALGLLTAGTRTGAFAGRDDGSLVTVGGVDVPLRYAADGVRLVRPKLAGVAGLFTTEPWVAVGEPATLVAIVSPSSATGNVTFRDGDAVLGSAPVVGGVARLTTAALAEGEHALRADYEGDVRTTAATTAVHRFTVTPAPPPAAPGPTPTPTPAPTPTPTPTPAPVVPTPPGAGSSTASPLAPVAAALRDVSGVALTTKSVAFRQRFDRAGRARWTVRAGNRTLGTATARVRPGERRVVVALGAAARRLLRDAHGAKLTLRTTLTLAAGVEVTVTRSLGRPAGAR